MRNIDSLLREALGSSETPAPELIRKVKYEMEKPMRKSTVRRSLVTAVAVFAAMLLISATAFAAWHFLKPGEVAEEFNDHSLSAAFESDTAINVNTSITSGGYIFTLLAVVTGNEITDKPYYNDSVQDDRTYAVIAIQNADGSPMPDTSEDAYAQLSFIASPLVKGLQPWLVNAWTMSGGYSETVADGIMYRLFECDGVTMFADRGLYFGIATGAFINNSVFLFDGETGEITANPDYDGACAVFELPLDKSLADTALADRYLLDMYPRSEGAALFYNELTGRIEIAPETPPVDDERDSDSAELQPVMIVTEG